LAALRSGEDREEVFRRIYERYRRPVHAYFARRGGSVEECRDLAQETFLRVFRGIDSFRAESRFETWVYEIAQNVWRNDVRDRLAKKRAFKTVALEDDVDAAAAGQEGLPGAHRGEHEELAGLLSAERVALLRAALAELPPQMRRCVELRLDQDLKFREIAVLMKVSIDTVKSQIAQAKTRLRGRLGSYFGKVDF
jgi:RNA polymerase sigma-70 factor (ECF subfamily)